MTTYPRPTDPVNALTRKDGSTEAHSTDHGRIIGVWENARAAGAAADANIDAKTGTDDTAVFQQLLADQATDNGFWNNTGPEPYTIFAPPGRYNITHTLSVPASTRIVGAGNGTIFGHNVPAGGALFEIDGSNCTISDCVIAPMNEDSGPAISIPGTSGNARTNTRIENVQFRFMQGATYFAIDTSWALETYIRGCRFIGCEGGGIHLGDTSNGSSIRDCVLSNGGAGALGGIFLEANGCLVEGNVVEAWRGSYGYKLNCANATLLRNWNEDNNGAAFDLGTSADVTLIGNNVSGNASTTYGIDINQGKRIFIAQNVVQGAQTAACSIRSGAALGQESSVVLSSNVFGGVTTGRVDTSGLLNAQDTVLRMGERRDDLPGPAGIEVVAGDIRLASASLLNWAPSVDGAADVYMGRSAANVISMGSADSMRHVPLAHGSLPAPSGYASGAQLYCSTDKQPVWSDGSAHWVDAAGANHT